jgi:hypothetical protein
VCVSGCVCARLVGAVLAGHDGHTARQQQAGREEEGSRASGGALPRRPPPHPPTPPPTPYTHAHARAAPPPRRTQRTRLAECGGGRGVAAELVGLRQLLAHELQAGVLVERVEQHGKRVLLLRREVGVRRNVELRHAGEQRHGRGGAGRGGACEGAVGCWLLEGTWLACARSCACARARVHVCVPAARSAPAEASPRPSRG